MAAVPLLLLLLGVFACAMSVIFIKNCEVDPVMLTGWRLLIAAVALTPVYIRDWRKHRAQLVRSHYTDPLIPGVVLTLHFFSWMYGARLTTAVNATVLVNLVPIAMPLLLIPLAGERLNRRELVATIVAAIGLVILCQADYHMSKEYLYGDLVCLGSMMLLAVYLALGRRYRHHPTIWLYLVPLYYLAAILSFLLAPWMAHSTYINWQQDGLSVLALGLVPTVIGHSMLNNAMRYFRGQVVALASMLQFVFAGILGYFFLSEPPPQMVFYPACGLILLAGVIVVLGEKREAAGKKAAAESA
ncbi:DMT family transporter [Aeoliella mucimassa]|uniref:EamA-like transporter family protein n=1 Tax=Aeoliella mucimassa TaxID=2527972 RepID=A0A518AKL9_9BACT|nr:DMT family transporter [Aeoliella mucimassa]QDU55273.1 EamA-like transporter family protein [Aeoliella mucimassa]